MASVSALIVLTCGSLCAAEYSYEDIRNGIADSDTLVSSFSVSTSFVRTVPSDVVEGKLFILRDEASYTVDGNGRVRYTSVGQTLFDGESPTVFDWTVLSTYDGEVVRTMNGATGYTHGSIDRSRSAISWITDPREFVRHFLGKRVSHIMQQRRGAVVGHALWEGRPVVVVETDPVRNSGCNWKNRFHVDVDRNFTVVRKAALVQYEGYPDWTEYASVETYQHDQLAPGVWLPLHVEYEHVNVREETVKHKVAPALVTRWIATNADWRIDPEVSDSDFTFDFASGVFVNDRVTGTTFKTAGITDQMIADQVSEAERLKVDAGGGRTVRHWVVIANGMLLVLLIAFMIIGRIGKRNPASQSKAT